jgi:hypothetical protein
MKDRRGDEEDGERDLRAPGTRNIVIHEREQ